MHTRYSCKSPLRGLALVLLTLVCASGNAASLNLELLDDPGFDDASAWSIGPGFSRLENGRLLVINHAGLIVPTAAISLQPGTRYHYSLAVTLLNNPTGAGRIELGAQTIWTPADGVGIFTGTLLAADNSGLVFNFLTPYTGRAEFDHVSVQSVVPVPAGAWLLLSALPAVIARRCGRRRQPCSTQLALRQY